MGTVLSIFMLFLVRNTSRVIIIRQLFCFVTSMTCVSVITPVVLLERRDRYGQSGTRVAWIFFYYVHLFVFIMLIGSTVWISMAFLLFEMSRNS